MTVSAGRALLSRFSAKLAACAIAQPVLEPSHRWFRREAAHGLRAGNFRVEYQPIVHIETRAACGFEALVRWRHPNVGEIAPDRFISVLEGTSVLGLLTEFVVGRVQSDIVGLDGCGTCHVAINVSPTEFGQSSTVDAFIDAAAAMPRDVTLILELTERGEFKDSACVRDSLKRIRRAGIKLALDDFGTCRSNIDLLERIQFDFLKIDRRFVARLNEGGEFLLSAFQNIARSFELVVVAEGVETETQHATLCAAGVELAQGYLYGRPASPRESLWKFAAPAFGHAEDNVVEAASCTTG
jgi:c-di-GMP phosphodiesterase